MHSCIALFTLSFVLAVGLTWAVRTLARRLRLLDKPSGRRVHRVPVPRIGGLAVFMATVAALLAFFFLYESMLQKAMLERLDLFWGLLAGATIIVIVGLMDDARGISPVIKLLGTLLGALIVCWGGLEAHALRLPMIGTIHLGWLALPLAVIWVLGCTHAMNLIDGIDGLASGIGLVMSATLFVLSMMSGNWVAAVIAATVAGACLGFLLFNFHPASIFLGDCGSLFLGFSLGSLCLVSARSHAAVAGAVALVIFGLPILDTVAAIVRRWLRRLPISASDRQHIHHRLLQMGLSHRQVALALYAVCAVLGTTAVVLSVSPDVGQLLVLGVLGSTALVLNHYFGWVSVRSIWQRLRTDAGYSRRSGRIWRAIANLGNEIEQSPALGSIPQLVEPVLREMNLDRCTIAFEGSNGNPLDGIVFVWNASDNGHAPQSGNGNGKHNGNGTLDHTSFWRSSYQIETDEGRQGRIEIEKNGDADDLPRDIGYMVMRVAGIIGSHPGLLSPTNGGNGNHESSSEVQQLLLDLEGRPR